MKVLILGGDGMLGHQLFKHLRDRHDVRTTLRQEFHSYADFNLFSHNDSYYGVDVRSNNSLIDVMSDFHPDAVVNAVGIVKQRNAAKESVPSLEINALLPHRLALLCKATRARLVHMSTDCVFSGRKGNYKESDPSDAEDLYGKTKFLGEVHDTNCITLRTSIIGRELTRKKSLLEWFIAQRGTVKGFKKAIFSGFTTAEMGRIIEHVLVNFPKKSGLYQVSSDPISKFDLLTLMKKEMNLSIEIIPDEEFQCDRSLDSSKFRGEFNYHPPSWKSMIEELV